MGCDTGVTNVKLEEATVVLEKVTVVLEEVTTVLGKQQWWAGDSSGAGGNYCVGEAVLVVVGEGGREGCWTQCWGRESTDTTGL